MKKRVGKRGGEIECVGKMNAADLKNLTSEEGDLERGIALSNLGAEL